MTETRRNELVDWYELLEVSPRASHAVIQAAYRALARNCHPDRNPGPEAAQRILQLNAAYGVVGDPNARARYDLECARARRRNRTLGAEHTSHPIPAASPRVRVLPPRTPPVNRLAEDPFRVVSAQVVMTLLMAAAVATLVLMLVWASLSPSAENTEWPAAPMIEMYRR